MDRMVVVHREIICPACPEGDESVVLEIRLVRVRVMVTHPRTILTLHRVTHNASLRWLGWLLPLRVTVDWSRARFAGRYKGGPVFRRSNAAPYVYEITRARLRPATDNP